MSAPREVPPPIRPRFTRFGWSLAAWLGLSLAACLVGLAVHRPAERPAGRTASPPATGSAASVDGPAVSVDAPAVSVDAPAPASARVPASASARVPASASARAPAARSGPVTADGSSGWQLRLFFTAASAYYRGPMIPVIGCANVACRPGSADLGRYPHDFVAAVRTQGSGRIDSGAHRGHYLDWDAVRGYWLDTVPRGPGAVRLRPFVSVISSTPQLSARTALRVASCGAGSRAGWAAVCARLRASSWSVAAVAVPAVVPAAGRTVRLYIGTENRSGFAAGPWADTFRSAVLRVG